MGVLGRYLSGLGAAALGLCAAGWLVLTPFAFGYARAGLHAAARADWATGGGLAVVCAATLFCWASAWRGRLRADGVLAGAPRRQARRDARDRRRLERAGGPAAAPDPAQILQELRVLLRPLLPEPEDLPPAAAPADPDDTRAPADPDDYEPVAAALDHPAAGRRETPEEPPALPAPSGLAAIESILSGGELLMAGVGEEDAW